jgi:methylglutaconyl-CoA hydratase
MTIENETATVTLDRPDVHNALNDVFMHDLTTAYRELADNGDVRVVVLRGTGRSFCAGADINWMKRMVDYSIDENIKDANILVHMLRAIRECPKPTIARVHGAAFGAGVGLAAACDMTIALRPAIFCLSEVKLGIVPAVISPYVLEKIGSTHARRYALTAERFDGEEARRIGLASEVVDDEAAMDAWIAGIIEHIRGNGPNAVAACKQIMGEIQPFQWEKAAKMTTERLAEIRVSPEGQEGLKSFLEKRKPSWAARK